MKRVLIGRNRTWGTWQGVHTEGHSVGLAQHLGRTEFLKGKCNNLAELEDFWSLGIKGCWKEGV